MRCAAVMTLLLFIGSESRAQDESSRINFGIKGGFSSSHFTDDVAPFDQPDEKFGAFKRSERFSFVPGITMDVQLTRGFSFITELLYNTRGMEYSEKIPRLVIRDRDGGGKKCLQLF